MIFAPTQVSIKARRARISVSRARSVILPQRRSQRNVAFAMRAPINPKKPVPSASIVKSGLIAWTNATNASYAKQELLIRNQKAGIVPNAKLASINQTRVRKNASYAKVALIPGKEQSLVRHVPPATTRQKTGKPTVSLVNPEL